MIALLKKDFSALVHALLPALVFCLPLVLLLGFTNEIETGQRMHWRSVLWISFFISSTFLFYRSFYFENRSQNFYIYRALKVPLICVFGSQVLTQSIGCLILGLCAYLLSIVFWSPSDASFGTTFKLLLLCSFSLSPIGSLLGLCMRFEREFLFALFYIPLATPLVLGAHSLHSGSTGAWAPILLIFLIFSLFFSALIFQFFFDELTERL